jgi:hypothetical protein
MGLLKQARPKAAIAEGDRFIFSTFVASNKHHDF